MQAHLGLLFLFSAFLLSIRSISPSCVDGLAFSHPGLPLPPSLPTTGSHRSDRAGNCFRWCRSLTRLSKPHTGAHSGEFRFCVQNEVTPPPLGGGAGFLSTWDPSVLLDSPTTAPHGSNRAGNPFRWCRSPTQLPKPHTGPHRAEFGFHRLFLPAFLGGSAANWRSRW